jgi:hypothetical protein
VARHGRLPPVFIVVSVFAEAIASFVPQYRGRRRRTTTGANALIPPRQPLDPDRAP